MKFFSGLRMKIIVPALIVVLLGVSAMVLVVLNIFNEGYLSLSSSYIHTLTANYSKQIESRMAMTLSTAETLSRSIEAMVEREDSSREEMLELVARVLKGHDELVGIGVGFEPNAFDGEDDLNIGQFHSNEQGRFVPYSFSDNGEIKVELLVGYDDLGVDGSWYHVPKSTNQSYVTDPYWYEVGSDKYLIFTCVAPILDKNGQFIGMVGFDTRVDLIKSIVESAQLFDTGYLSLLSPNGTIAYHPKEELTGQLYQDVFSNDLVTAMDKLYEEGSVEDIEIMSVLTGEKSHVSFESIEVGLSGGKWVVATIVPVKEINKISRTSNNFSIVAGVVLAVLIMIVLTLIINRLVLKPTRMIRKASEQMSKGSLDIDIPYHSSDEFGDLARNFENTGQILRTYVRNISDTLGELSSGNMAVRIDQEYIGDFAPIKTSIISISEYLNTALMQLHSASDLIFAQAKQMTGGSQTLSSGALQQSTVVEQLVDKISDFSIQFKQIASNASDASGKTSIASKEVAECNEKMQNMLIAMNDISNASGEIQVIIKSIEEIAFQTNILSLNAAVEAARAGSAGKGFAVVADEVRSLAARSSNASKDTAVLIERSIQAVQNGVELANEAADSLLNFTNGLYEISDTIDSISDASNGQGDSISDVVRAVDQISSVAQSTSAAAEESAAVSNELANQAMILDDLVSKFELK